MSAERKLRRLKAANDPRNQKPAPLISVVTLAQNPQSFARLIVGGVLLVSLGMMAITVWLIQKDSEPELIAPKSDLAALQQTPPHRLTDIRLPVPASSLSPNAVMGDAQTVNDVAGKIKDLPALKPKPAIHVSSVDGEDSHDLLIQAHASLEAADYAEAIGLYNRVLAADRRNHDALSGKIYALAKSGDSAEAIEASRILLAIYPHDAVAEANSAHILMQAGRNAEAIAALDRAAKTAPDNLNYRLDLAGLYDHGGHAAAALMLYRQVADAALQKGANGLPLAAIQRRIAYLETLAGTGPESSTTLPVDN